MFCQKCGAKNDDSAAFCNKCGAAIAIVAILLVAGAGLAFWQFGNGGDDSAVFTPTDGVFVLTDPGSTNHDKTALYKGTVTITIDGGNMYYSMNLDKKDTTKDGVTISPAVIKRYTVDMESHNTPLPPNYSPMNDMKACFPFLNGYSTTSIMCTFSDGSTEVEAYKFVNSGLARAIYVSTDGVIYQWCERVDDVGTSFILDGWTRTSNYSGYFC